MGTDIYPIETASIRAFQRYNSFIYSLSPRHHRLRSMVPGGGAIYSYHTLNIQFSSNVRSVQTPATDGVLPLHIWDLWDITEFQHTTNFLSLFPSRGTFWNILYGFTFKFIHAYLADSKQARWQFACCHLTWQHTNEHVRWQQALPFESFTFSSRLAAITM